jgi:magnesium transporter
MTEQKRLMGEEERRRATPSGGGGGIPEADLLGTGEGSVTSHDRDHEGRMLGGTTVGDVNSPTASPPDTFAHDPDAGAVPNEEPTQGPFVRRRQRKMSQSNTTLPHGGRRQGRLALFEGIGGLMGDGNARDSFSVNMSPDDRDGPLRGLTSALPTKAARMVNKNNNMFGSNPGGNEGMPTMGGYSDYPEPIRARVGGERPYRFSFYSNALPATIHARSMSELPAEGQTFEDLFAGRGSFPGGGNGRQGSESGTRSGTSTPIEKGDLNGTVPNPKMSLLARATSKAGGSPSVMEKNEIVDPEANTWWLDVLSPTDEEMRMLAKVLAHLRPVYRLGIRILT